MTAVIGCTGEMGGLVTCEVWTLPRCGHLRDLVTCEVWSLATCDHIEGGKKEEIHVLRGFRKI
jgi:hypothetical protein